MVMFNWLAAVLPLVSVVTGQVLKTNTTLPSLSDATIEELATGLEAKLFTSVDLVNVSALDCKYILGLILTVHRLTLHAFMK